MVRSQTVSHARCVFSPAVLELRLYFFFFEVRKSYNFGFCRAFWLKSGRHTQRHRETERRLRAGGTGHGKLFISPRTCMNK
jgi:hypothetical protein